MIPRSEMNGHGHGHGHPHGPGHAPTPPNGSMSASVIRTKERMDGLFNSLAQGNENTWLLIGTSRLQLEIPRLH